MKKIFTIFLCVSFLFISPHFQTELQAQESGFLAFVKGKSFYEERKNVLIVFDEKGSATLKALDYLENESLKPVGQWAADIPIVFYRTAGKDAAVYKVLYFEGAFTGYWGLSIKNKKLCVHGDVVASPGQINWDKYDVLQVK